MYMLGIRDTPNGILMIFFLETLQGSEWRMRYVLYYNEDYKPKNNDTD